MRQAYTRAEKDNREASGGEKCLMAYVEAVTESLAGR